MKLEYNLDIKDIMSFQENFIENSEEWQKQKKNRYIIIPALMTLIGLFDYLWHKRFSLFLMVVFGLLSLIWILHVKRNFQRNILESFEKALEEGETEHLFGHKILEFTTSGFTYSETDSEQKVSREEVSEIRETEAYYFILVSSYNGIIVPKDKLGLSEKELNELKEILNTFSPCA